MMLFILTAAIAAIFFSLGAACLLLAENQGSKLMSEMAHAFLQQIKAFLFRNDAVLAIGAGIITLLLFILNWRTAASFAAGASWIALACHAGLVLPDMARPRAAEAAGRGWNAALRTAFSSGTIASFGSLSLGLLAITLLYALFRDPAPLIGFAAGASAAALFFSMSSSILPAAGLGTRISSFCTRGTAMLGSAAAGAIAAMLLSPAQLGQQGILLPLQLLAAGIIACILASFAVRSSSEKKLRSAVRNSMIIASLLAILASYYLIGRSVGNIGVWFAFLCGSICSVAALFFPSRPSPDQQFLREARPRGSQGSSQLPLRTLLRTWWHGAAAPFIPLLALLLVLYLSFFFAGLYGIAIASIGMLSLAGLWLSICTSTTVWGEIQLGDSRNGKRGRNFRDGNDGKANSTKANSIDGRASSAINGKASSVISSIRAGWERVDTTAAVLSRWASLLAAIAFLSSLFVSLARSVSLANTGVLLGALAGGAFPFLVLAAVSSAVEAAGGDAENNARNSAPRTAFARAITCNSVDARIAASVRASLLAMAVPGVVIIFLPILVGFVLGVEAWEAMLAGTLLASLAGLLGQKGEWQAQIPWSLSPELASSIMLFTISLAFVLGPVIVVLY
ncbi:sodium/proton-translocating pyrophosphatase [Candidatus Woesearchaeota archaeon]|nr:sodium/proton-translocating pyrophosphatase [Candidatus Woesearchaeota archaeon]